MQRNETRRFVAVQERDHHAAPGPVAATKPDRSGAAKRAQERDVINGDGRGRRRLDVPQQPVHPDGTGQVCTGSPLSTCAR